MEIREIIDLIIVGLVMIGGPAIVIYKARSKTKTVKKL